MTGNSETSNGATSVDTATKKTSNAYEISLPAGRTRLIWLLAGAGLVMAVVAAFFSDGPTLWGLLPIVLYAILAILGMDIVVATVISVVAGLIIGKMGVLEIGTLLGDSLADQITIIGLIIMLGAGVGEVLKVTGVAQSIVSSVMHVFGRSGRNAVVFGVMISCLILVASLGTLAGAIAIAAPILLPITARLGFTKSATASMLFIGGCAGLAIAPFAGSNVAIMEAADVNYGQFILYGAGPIAILSLTIGVPIVSLMQRWSARKGDFYLDDEVGGSESPVSASRIPTAVFLTLLVISVVFAAVTSAGTTFPLLALPVLGIATAVASRMSPQDIVSTIYRGCSQVISIFLLFWLLAALFIIIDILAPFDVVMDVFGSQLQSASPFVFTVIIALLGWVGVPGATAAQVVLLDKVFGDLGATLGVSASSWVVVLLFASKADTYGPFPNGNMIGVMGLARSNNLRNMLITGWMLLVPACVMYFIILFVETR